MDSRRAFVRVGPTGRLRLSPTHSHSPDSGENQVEPLPDSPVAPWWPKRPWFNTIFGLLYDYPREFPLRRDLLSQRGRLHADPGMFHLHVWPLSGDPCRRNVFLRGLQPSLPLQGENPLERSMMLVGNSSQSGVYKGKLIPSIPLLDK